MDFFASDEFRFDSFDFNPCGKNDQLVVNMYFAKNSYAMQNKKREAKLCAKILNLRYFYVKLCSVRFVTVR